MKKKIFVALLIFIISSLALFACEEPVTPEIPGSVKLDGMVFVPSGENNEAYELIGCEGEPEELVIPESLNGKPVVEIGNSAFYNSPKLAKITIPSSIRLIDAYAFDNCYKLTELVFLEGVETIGFNAFSDCESLVELKLPDSLKTIGTGAFSRCSSLEKIYVKSGIETIEKDAFLGCSAIAEIHVDDIADWCKISFENIEANPLSKAERLFVNEEHVENLTITGATEVSKFSFYGFLGLKTLTLGEGVEVVGNSAFSNCTSLTKLTLSDSVKEIGTSAFNTCSSLEYIVVGSGIESFAGLAFYACSSIYAVEILDLIAWCEAFFYTDNSGTANPLRYADVIIFDGKEVSELVLPFGVKKISTLAFIGFKGTALSLPASIRVIQDTAFYLCDNLTKVRFDGTPEEFHLISIGANNFAKVEVVECENEEVPIE